MEDANQKLRPWIAIWIRPTDTMQFILSRPLAWRSVIAIIALNSVVWMIDGFSSFHLADRGALANKVFMGFVGGIIVFPLVYMFIAWAYRFFGRWVKGKGSYYDVLSAVVWGSMIPGIFGLLWIPKILIFGKELFSVNTPLFDGSMTLRYLHYGFMVLDCVGLVYGFYISVKLLAVAQKISAIRALLNILISLSGLFLFFVGLVSFIFLLKMTTIASFTSQAISYTK